MCPKENVLPPSIDKARGICLLHGNAYFKDQTLKWACFKIRGPVIVFLIIEQHNYYVIIV